MLVVLLNTPGLGSSVQNAHYAQYIRTWHLSAPSAPSHLVHLAHHLMHTGQLMQRRHQKVSQISLFSSLTDILFTRIFICRCPMGFILAKLTAFIMKKCKIKFTYQSHCVTKNLTHHRENALFFTVMLTVRVGPPPPTPHLKVNISWFFLWAFNPISPSLFGCI